MDIDEAIYKAIVSFLTDFRVQFQRLNERPWGTYELAMSFDGEGWFQSGRPFGWGFTNEHAAVVTLKEHVSTEPPDAAFMQFIGPDKLAILKDRIALPNNSTALPSGSSE